MSATVKKLSWEEGEVPEEVRSFCRAKDVVGELRLAVETLLRSFPEAEEVVMRLEADGETGGQWVVVQAVIRGRCAQAFSRHRDCVRRWVAQAKPAARAAIWPTYTLEPSRAE